MKKTNWLWALVMFGIVGCVIAEDEKVFYKGNYGPDADYILSGGLIKDLPPPIKVPVDYKGKGFVAERLSKVPPPGVHPRVIMSPSDIENMKKMVKMGDKAPRFFRIQLEQLKRNKDWKVPQNFAYWHNPFGEDGKIAGWALLALLTDDKELGEKAAKATVDLANFLEPRVDILNSIKEAEPIKAVSYDFVRTGLRFGPFTYIEAYHAGGKKRVEELMKKYGVELAHTGDHTGAYYVLGWAYDYAYNFMTPEQRDIVRRVISKCTYGKYDTGMAIPGQMYINNHMSSGANWIPLALAIEGEKGYDERILPIAIWSLKNKLTYDLSSDGITYENTKGFIPVLAVLACARRQGADDPENLLKHSHLLSRANSNVEHARKLYNRYIGRHRYREGTPQLDKVKTGLDEPRFWRASGGSGSGGHLEFWYVLKHFYPNDPMIDFVYNAKNSDFNAEIYEGKSSEKYGSRLHYSWFNLPALFMMTAAPDTDYNKKDSLDQFKNLPEFWFDSERGMVAMRNGWDKDSMLVHMENRIDQYYAGHETPQQGDFQIWADGIPWSPNLGAYRDSSFRSMVTVDGLAGVYSPVSGDWMTAHNTPEAATSVGEMTTSYQWRKLSKLMHLDHPALEQSPLKMGHFSQAAYDQDRFTELPYLPKIKEHYDGFAHLDYGPWHGETRGVERYGKWNDPMRYVFRTINFARGNPSAGSGQGAPYLLVMDDLDKDGKKHQYDWRMPVIGDSYVYSINPATQNRHLEHNTDGAIGTDIILALADDKAKRDRASVWGTVYPIMKPQPKKGDPMLLVRVLWRNTNYPYPVPNVQKYWEYNMISVPAYTDNPEYKIMVFPHRFGDKLPVTTWSDDMGQLTVKAGGNVDVYQFDKTDRNRTVFTMSRNGKKINDSRATPPMPLLVEKGNWTVDQNRPEWRQSRIIVGSADVQFQSPAPGARIHYTIDGSEPGKDSPVYTKPITIDKSCVLKARTYQDDWRCGNDKWSQTASFEFEKQTPVAGINVADTVPGLMTRGYEIKTTMFDKKGFFQGSKNSLPDISKYQPLVSSVSNGFDIPFMEGQEPAKMMNKGFYTFDGYFDAPETGVYYFEVESCGPVDFKIGEREVILVNQQYGLSYKKRYGEVALAKGQHKLHLTVCDTMLWKGKIETPYQISVAVKVPGSANYAPVSASALSCSAPFAIAGKSENVDAVNMKLIPAKQGMTFTCQDKPVANNTITLKQPGVFDLKIKASLDGKQIGPTIEKRVVVLQKYPGKQMTVVPGIMQEKYDRIALSPAIMAADGLPLAFFDVKDVKPYASAVVGRMDSNDSTRKLIEYKGFLRISRGGMYEFKLHHGRKNAAQLIIDGQVLARQQVAAPAVSGKIYLEPGLHSVNLQVALGKAVIYMKGSGENDFKTVGVAALARPATPEVMVANEPVNKNDIEIFQSEKVALSSPIAGAEVRYVIGKGTPDKVYSAPLSVEKSQSLTAQLFEKGKAIGEARTLNLAMSSIPMDGLVGYLDCENIDSGMTNVKYGKDAKAVVTLGTLEPGKKGKAIGFYEDASRISLRDLPTHEDASTVSAWVKLKKGTDFFVVTGVPYQSEEYDLRFRGSRFWAEFKRNIGSVNAPIPDYKKAVETGKWFHVAATYGDEIKIYFNGELIGSAQVFNKNMRRGSGRSPDLELMERRNAPTDAALDEFRIYNRVLAPAEIKALYNADK